MNFLTQVLAAHSQLTFINESTPNFQITDSSSLDGFLNVQVTFLEHLKNPAFGFIVWDSEESNDFTRRYECLLTFYSQDSYQYTKNTFPEHLFEQIHEYVNNKFLFSQMSLDF